MTVLAQKEPAESSSSLNDILIPVKSEIDKIENHLSELLDSEVPFVRQVAEYIIGNGGKRLRPILTVLSAKMSGHQGIEAYNMGACLEFIHTASLLHDDVVDNAPIRRGKPTANAKWGNHVSVLVGDFFYCRASQLLTSQGSLKILKIVTDCITATTEGEVLEIITNSDLSTKKEDYLNIIKNKTALLISAACQTGAVLGNVSAELEKAFQDYGFHFGMAFQLADDALDYLSKEDVFGKASGKDLQEGKLTLPLIVAMEKANKEEAQFLKNALLSDRLERDVFLKVIEIVKAYHGFDETYELAKKYIVKAKASLNPFRPSIEKDILLSLADYVVTREK